MSGGGDACGGDACGDNNDDDDERSLTVLICAIQMVRSYVEVSPSHEIHTIGRVTKRSVCKYNFTEGDVLAQKPHLQDVPATGAAPQHASVRFQATTHRGRHQSAGWLAGGDPEGERAHAGSQGRRGSQESGQALCLLQKQRIPVLFLLIAHAQGLRGAGHVPCALQVQVPLVWLHRGQLTHHPLLPPKHL